MTTVINECGVALTRALCKCPSGYSLAAFQHQGTVVVLLWCEFLVSGAEE